jgi:hypothetical protein
VEFLNDSEIQENIFFCKELPEKSKAQDILNVGKQKVCLERTV